jgi:hypothetical protein
LLFLLATGFRVARSVAQTVRPIERAAVDSRLRIFIKEAAPPGPEALRRALEPGVVGKPVVTFVAMEQHPGPFGEWLSLEGRSTVPLYAEGALQRDITPTGDWRTTQRVEIQLLTLLSSSQSDGVRRLKSEFACSKGWSSTRSLGGGAELATCELDP